MRADRHRLRRWRQFIDPIDLHAIELLLEFLTSASRELSESAETRPTVFLPARIADDVRMALESILSGHLRAATDAMRDVLETELLVRDFARDTAQIARWHTADEATLRKKFRPVHCRQRLASALHIDIDKVPGATDYKAHSMLLHVGQGIFPALSPAAGHQAIHVIDAISDIMFHGLSSVQAVGDLLIATHHAASGKDEAQAALEEALEDLRGADGAMNAMAKKAADAISANEKVEVRVFESGLVVSFNIDTKQTAFYKMSRTDFRHLHREALSAGATSFGLTPLDDGDPCPADAS